MFSWGLDNATAYAFFFSGRVGELRGGGMVIVSPVWLLACAALRVGFVLPACLLLCRHSALTSCAFEFFIRGLPLHFAARRVAARSHTLCWIAQGYAMHSVPFAGMSCHFQRYDIGIWC